MDRLLDVLVDTGFPSTRFEVEVIESALIDDFAVARRVLLAMKSVGIHVTLDDFGTGYSSLSNLSELPFEKIKIDRSFVHTMHEHAESKTIVNAIISLASSLNMSTTAEGIETESDAQALAALGCRLGQGYFYSKAVPAHEVAALIKRFG